MQSIPNARIVGAIVIAAMAGGCSVPPVDAPRVAESPVASVPAVTAVEPFPGVRVTRDGDASTVELDGEVCIEAGWLEQIACGPQSREHESLIVPTATPRQVHAALLMAGFEPGAPGSWSYEEEQYRYTAPTGSALSIGVRRPDGTGGSIEEPIRRWIRDHHGREEFPDAPWIFAGSRIESEAEGDFYVAEYTGSIIGLVTFGDEVIGFSRVLSDQTGVQPAEWEADTDRIPEVGTPVTLIIRRVPQGTTETQRHRD